MQGLIVRVSQNFTSSSAPIIVSSYDVLPSSNFHLLWQWNKPHGSNASSTHPAIDDEKRIIYVGILPYLYAIDSRGITIWKTQITTKDEMNKYNLQTFFLL